MGLRAVPLTREQAAVFIEAHHRHHGPLVCDKFRIGAELDGRLVGVVQVGNPCARGLCDGLTLEVSRCCTDGTPNVCSWLYSRAARVAREMGYARIVTYVLDSEDGASLVASGWRKEADTRGHKWGCPSRPRQTSAPTCNKQRWVKVLTDNPAPVDFPKDAPRRNGHEPLSLLRLS